MLDLSNLMALQDNPIFPEGNEIETAEKVMKDFTVSAAAFQTSESKIELLEAREKMAVLEKGINIKQQKIEEQMRLIEKQEKEIEDLKESSDSKSQILQQQIEALKESHASKSQTKQQEMETLKESHASAIRILLENHAKEIAKTKTKVWVCFYYLNWSVLSLLKKFFLVFKSMWIRRVISLLYDNILLQ